MPGPASNEGRVWPGAYRAPNTGGRQKPAAPYDPSGDLVGFILSGLNGAWDTPGTPGSMVSQAGLRRALQGSAAQAEADRANVYGQVQSNIAGRAPEIQAGYDNATKTLQDNARSRALADRESAGSREQDAIRAAAALGLSVAPSANTLANQAMENNIGAFQSIADAWGGFNSASANTALERNAAVGDAFAYEGTQQQERLQRMLLQALAGAQDYYSPGSGGSSLSPTKKLSGGLDLLDWISGDTRNDIAAAKLRPQVTLKQLLDAGTTQTTKFYN